MCWSIGFNPSLWWISGATLHDTVAVHPGYIRYCNIHNDVVLGQGKLTHAYYNIVHNQPELSIH